MRAIIYILISVFSLAFTPAAISQVIKDGVYYICSGIDGQYCIDNTSSIVSYGNNIQLWKSNKTNAQKWRVTNRNGGIVIKSENNNNYVIDNNHSIISNGNNIQLWENNGGNAQLWYPQKVGENRYVLRSAINRNFVIDVSGSGMFDGNNIQLWEYNGTNAQVWVFNSVDKSMNNHSTNTHPASGGTNTYPAVQGVPIQVPDYCGVCSRTGLCPTCNGTGISTNGHAHICGACGGQGKCTTCHGSGISGYHTEYKYY